MTTELLTDIAARFNELNRRKGLRVTYTEREVARMDVRTVNEKLDEAAEYAAKGTPRQRTVRARFQDALNNA